MNRSTRELVLEALDILRVLEPGQPVPDEDYARTKGKVSGLLGALRGSRVLDLFVDPVDEDSLDIPDYMFNGLAVALANEASTSFGQQKDLDPNLGGGAWQQLKDALADSDYDAVLRVEYF